MTVSGSTSDSRVSSSHRQTEAAVDPGTQNRVCRECRVGSISSREFQPGSDTPGAAIQLTYFAEIEPVPLPWSESPGRPYPCSDLFAGSDNRHIAADFGIPLRGKPL
jgi:hypothetical protein